MWTLNRTIANLHGERLDGEVDLEHPGTGLHAARYQLLGQAGCLVAGNILGLELPGSTETEVLRDSWIRGADLVAAYSSTTRRAAEPEVYWRSLNAPDAAGLELIVSVHTGLLDDRPSAAISTRLKAEGVWWLPTPDRPDLARRLSATESKHSLMAAEGAGLLIVRLPSTLSYVELVYPSDFCSCVVQWQRDQVRIDTPLFPDRLEKGVIRRARVRGWIVPAANDLAIAGRLYREFADSAPPLTT